MIKICADSTCDLSEELVKRYGITIIPLHIMLGETEYRDRIDISQDEIFEWADKNKTTPKTSAVSVTDAMDVMRELIDAKDEIILFTIASGMSTTYNVFNMVAEELDTEGRVHVIDSMNLSTGIGLMVIEAACMAKEGMSAENIVNEIERIRLKVRSSFVIDTLTYLARGGRCSSVAALTGGVLKIHPKIVVKDGKMEVSKKYRGNIRNVVMDYVKDMHYMLLEARPRRVFITHTSKDRELVEEVRSYLEELGHFDEILETNAGAVISSHCGPGTLGVLFIEG
ncbi:MAG: DegV family protein [Lachnospiraceae bacterium]|nr:DegV family protein [Lachnospiraceae bacterium]